MVTRLRPIAVALGSNQGHREANLQYGAACLGEFLNDISLSTFIETMPEGGSDQPTFLNAAAVGWSGCSPMVLLERLLSIEKKRGRKRPYAGAPRTLDLDLILVGDLIVTEPRLVVPHPRFRRRHFVLSPLAEVAPKLVDPLTTLTIQQLLEKLKAKDGDNVSKLSLCQDASR